MHLTYRSTTIVHMLAAIFAAVTLTGCDADDERKLPQNIAPSSITGSFDIYYSIQTSETTGEGTGTTPVKATAIHFYDEYIVVVNSGSRGRIFPIRKINSFSWKSNQ